MKLPKRNTIKFLDSKNHDYFGHDKLSYEFHNMIMSNGILFDKDGVVLPETLDEHIFWNPSCISRFMHDKNILNKQVQIRRRDLKNKHEQALKHSDFINVDNCVDLTHPFGFYAFGHLFDTLQRLYSIKSQIQDPNIKFIVSRYHRITDFTKHLSALSERDIRKEDLLVANKLNLRIHNLKYSLSPTIPTEIDRDAYSWILERYFSLFNIKNIEPKYNLYLSRNHIKAGSRGVINEKEVIETLSKKEFIILNGQEPLDLVVEYFANAKIIIGAHGSMFTNSIFCNPETKIIEFCPNNRACYNFRNTFKIAENYRHILIEADESFNITIDTDALKSELEI
jgi:hypothetical protein